MGTYGIEISQGYATETFVGGAAVAEDILGNLFGVAVGRGGRLAGRLFGDWQFLGIAVHCRRRGEQHIRALEFLHHLQNVHVAYQIVLVVLQRFVHGFTHGLVGSEMNHGVESVPFENAAQRFYVAGVDFPENDLASDDFLDTIQSRGFRVGKVVDNHHIISGFDESHRGVCADVSGTSGYKNCLFAVHYIVSVLNLTCAIADDHLVDFSFVAIALREFCACLRHERFV